jgi:murein DD-endopeptidase MepM/ murein hydrolase activator NlpD
MTVSANLLLVLAAQGVTGGVWENPDTSKTEVRWDPPKPTQGSIVWITLRPEGHLTTSAGDLTASGSLAGQPLHFEPGDDGLFHSLAGIPINTRDSIQLALTFANAQGTLKQLFTYVPVADGVFSVANLSVDPRFTTPPDSALATRIAAEADSVRAILQRSHETRRLWLPGFVIPKPDKITSGYGQRREFNGELRSRHMGVDLDGDFGDPVVATNRGVVALVGEFYYAGSLVYLDHGRGLLTAYMHLSEITVAIGDTVAVGQVIGRVGASGRVTGPHLHWQARYGTVTVNPLTLLEVDWGSWSGN